MALIKCVECGKEISDKAKACIHCGNSIDKPQEKTKEQKTHHIKLSHKIIIILLIIPILVMLCGELKTLISTIEDTNNEDNIVEVEKRTWQEDALDDGTRSFMSQNLYATENYYLPDLYKKMKEMMSRHPSNQNNSFYIKFTEEYEKILALNLTDQEMEFLSLYISYNSSFFHLLFEEKKKNDWSFDIENIWSYNYNRDGSYKTKLTEYSNKKNSTRGFFIKFSDNTSFQILLHYNVGNDPNSTFTMGMNYRPYEGVIDEYEELKNTGEIKYDNKLSREWILESSNIEVIRCTKENKEYYKNLLEKCKSFIDFMEEYNDVTDTGRYRFLINEEEG